VIRVNVSTLAASRVAPPIHVRKLTAEALRDLQAVLNPVPADLVGLEWWPEVESVTDFNPATHKLGAESFTANAEMKTVLVTREVVARSADDIAAENLAVQKSRTEAIQKMMDTEAQARGYDGILSMCSYSTSTNPVFKREAVIAVPWRDAVWSTGYRIIADVKNGTRPLPTVEVMLGELPKPIWP